MMRLLAQKRCLETKKQHGQVKYSTCKSYKLHVSRSIVNVLLQNWELREYLLLFSLSMRNAGI